MATNVHNQFSLGKFGDMLFVRQAPVLDAKTHPSIYSRLADRYSAWRARRAAASELAGLSDRELADIGLTRQEIPVVVRHGRR